MLLLYVLFFMANLIVERVFLFCQQFFCKYIWNDSCIILYNCILFSNNFLDIRKLFIKKITFRNHFTDKAYPFHQSEICYASLPSLYYLLLIILMLTYALFDKGTPYLTQDASCI